MSSLLRKIMPAGGLAGERSVTEKTSLRQILKNRLQSIRVRFLEPGMFAQSNPAKHKRSLQSVSHEALIPYRSL